MCKLNLVKWLLNPICFISLALVSTSSLHAKEQKEPFLLATIDRSEGIPYQLMRDGHIISHGMTDVKGQIFTDLHKGGKPESWLIRTTGGVYGIHFSGKSPISLNYQLYSPHTYTDISEDDSEYKPSPNNYIAFTFFGKDSGYYNENEPYWVFNNDNRLIDSGITSHDTYGGVSDILTIPSIINSFKILTCSNTVFSIQKKDKSQDLYALSNYFDVTYDDSNKIQLTSVMKQKCEVNKSWQLNTPADSSVFNEGKSFLSVGIVPYKSREQEKQIFKKEREKQQIESEKAATLREQAYISGTKRFSGNGGVDPIGVCPDDLLGTFGIPANLPDSNIMDIAHELYFSNNTLPGDAAIKFYSESGNYYRKGLRSGSINKITITMGNNDEKGLMNSLMENKSYCYIDLNDDAYVYRMDYDQMSPDNFEDLRQYLGHLWGQTPSEQDLKNIHYLFGRTISEPGIGGASFLIPFQRMEK